MSLKPIRPTTVRFGPGPPPAPRTTPDRMWLHQYLTTLLALALLIAGGLL